MLFKTGGYTKCVTGSELFKYVQISYYYKHFDANRSGIVVLLLTLLGIVFLLPFGVISMSDGRFILSIVLFCSVTIGIANAYYLLRYKNVNLAKVNLAFITIILCLSLILTGGKDGTGLLWTYPIMAIMLVVFNVKQGIWVGVIYLILAFIVMIFSEQISSVYHYPMSYVTRYLYSSVALYAVLIILVYINDRFYNRLRELSITDTLTGVYNRSVINAEIQELIQSNKPENNALLLMDVDNFKTINDRFGHAAGDEILSSVAGAIMKLVRADDSVIRWGGEEFLIVLKQVSSADALKKADVIRQVIHSNAKICGITGEQVSVSIGVAMFEGADFYRSLNLADERLYLAKNQGRNRTVG